MAGGKAASVLFPVFPASLTEIGKSLLYKVIYEVKDEGMQKYNYDCCFIWV
jgi:hypothetical protein